MRNSAPFLLAILTFLLAREAVSREVFVAPVSNHQPLSCTTDDLSGYQIMPRQPLKLDVVGPGTLNLTIRLNHTRPFAEFSGSLAISRNDKPLKNVDLKLFRSRVGNYLQDKKLLFSLPKKLRIAVPEGVQHYTFSVKPGNCQSLYLAIQYESDADQSPVARDDMLALVPLGESLKMEGNELPLVPLAPAEKPVEKNEPAEKPAEKKEPATETAGQVAKARPAAEAAPKVSAQSHRAPDRELPPAEPTPAPTVKVSPPEVKEVKVAVISPPTADAPSAVMAKAGPAPRKPVISLGVKLGQISALQKVGGVSLTGSLDARYILPVMDGRLTIGMEFGAYRYLVEISTENRRVTTWVVPISLQVYYRLPLKTWLEPFVGLGADAFWCRGRDEHIYNGFIYASRSGMVFGGHLAAGLEGALGPGFVLAEVRAGLSFGDPGTWLNSPNIYGLAATVGYRLVF
jgi:hypothetical protein